jgi:hypothetical protein
VDQIAGEHPGTLPVSASIRHPFHSHTTSFGFLPGIRDTRMSPVTWDSG